MSSNAAASTNLTPDMRNAAQTAQWKEMLYQALCDMRVAIPGIILSFDSVEQTAKVQIALREKVQVPQTGPQDVPIQPLLDVPVVMPRGGGYSITLPLKPGDECLLVFADMCIDTWWQSGGVQNQFEKRRHDLSDVFCIPGPWNQQRVLPNYSDDSLQIRSDDGLTYIDISADGVKIVTPQNFSAEVGEDFEVTAGGDINLTATGVINMTGADVSISPLDGGSF